MKSFGKKRVAFLVLLLLVAEDCRATMTKPPLAAGRQEFEIARGKLLEVPFSESPEGNTSAAIPTLLPQTDNIQRALDIMIQWFPEDAEFIENQRRYAVQTILKNQAEGQRSSLLASPFKLLGNLTGDGMNPRYFTDSDCKDAQIEVAVNALMFVISFVGVVTPKPPLLARSLAKGLRGLKDEWFANLHHALTTLVQSNTLKQKTSALFDLIELLVFNGGEIIVQAMKETYSSADWVLTGASVIASFAIFGTSGGTAVVLKIASKYLSMASLVQSIFDLDKVCVKRRKYTKLKVAFKQRTKKVVTTKWWAPLYTYTLKYNTGVIEVTLPNGEKAGICYDGGKRTSCKNCHYSHGDTLTGLGLEYVPDSDLTNKVLCKALKSSSKMPEIFTFYPHKQKDINLPTRILPAGFRVDSSGIGSPIRGVKQHFKRYLRWSQIKCSGLEENLGQCVYSYKLMKTCAPNYEDKIKSNYEVHANCWQGYSDKQSLYR